MMASSLEIAEWLTAGAEKARQQGDTVASLALATKAAEYVQLARLLGNDESPATPAKGD